MKKLIPIGLAVILAAVAFLIPRGTSLDDASAEIMAQVRAIPDGTDFNFYLNQHHLISGENVLEEIHESLKPYKKPTTDMLNNLSGSLLQVYDNYKLADESEKQMIYNFIDSIEFTDVSAHDAPPVGESYVLEFRGENAVSLHLNPTTNGGHICKMTEVNGKDKVVMIKYTSSDVAKLCGLIEAGE
ncbi:MAG: hypothetical protein IJN37_09285 [Clostridia bacterium]|nr:hypothetical protein [Clostridia bacterium]